MPHPQSSVLKNHRRIARLKKRPQPARMEEILDGDRLLELLEGYVRQARREHAAALLDVAHGVELSFSSPEKRMRFKYLREKETHPRSRSRPGYAAA